MFELTQEDCTAVVAEIARWPLYTPSVAHDCWRFMFWPWNAHSVASFLEGNSFMKARCHEADDVTVQQKKSSRESLWKRTMVSSPPSPSCQSGEYHYIMPRKYLGNVNLPTISIFPSGRRQVNVNMGANKHHVYFLQVLS